jgi:type I restriction enzyme S subunit
MAIIGTAQYRDIVEADRLDAEFFDPADLALIHRLKQNGGKPLGDVCEVLNGRTPEDYIPDGPIPIVRSGDLVAPLIYPGCACDFLHAERSKKLVFLKRGDVLVSSIGMGSIGKISIVMDAGNFATVSEVTVLRSKGYPPEVIFAYLTTKAGQRQILRQVTGATGQQHLLKSKVETILVPPAPKASVCDGIRESVQRTWKLEIETARQHAETHSRFAKALGI